MAGSTGRRGRVELYAARIPLEGWGGLLVTAIVLAIAMSMPESRSLVVLGVAGGAALAAILIALRHRHAH
jgi:hypothetical protein